MKPRSARRLFVAATLASEALVVFFAGLVAYGLRMAEPAVVWSATAAIAVLALAGAGRAASRAGIVLGWLVQAALIVTSVFIPMMWPLALAFVAIWVASLRVGARIDRERAERAGAASR